MPRRRARAPLSVLLCPSLCLALCLALCLSSGAEALECPLPRDASPALASIDAERRLEFIRAALNQQASAARTWTTTWTIINTAMLAGQLVIIPFIDPAERVDYYVGAGYAAVGGLMFGAPLRVITDVRRLEAATHALGSTDPCGLLQRAELLLDQSTEDEALSSSLIAHAFNVVLNASAILVLGFGFQRWESGLISAGVGIVVGEVAVFTQPTRLIGLRRRYLEGQLDEVARGEAAGAGAVRIAAIPLVEPRRHGALAVVSLAF